MKLVWTEPYYEGRFEAEVGVFKCVAERDCDRYEWRIFAGGGDFPVKKGTAPEWCLDDCDTQCQVFLFDQLLELQKNLCK